MEAKELISKYYDVIKDKHPSLSLSDVEQMCRAPFTFVGRMFTTGLLPSVRLKYFGCFKVYYRKARTGLKALPKALAEGRIEQEQHDRIKQSLETFLKEHKNADKETDTE